jgi:hypothetical protein
VNNSSINGITFSVKWGLKKQPVFLGWLNNHYLGFSVSSVLISTDLETCQHQSLKVSDINY